MASSSISLHYRKTKAMPTTTLENNYTKLSNVQNYVPIYQRFFDINEHNYNSIQLNQHYFIHSILGLGLGLDTDTASSASLEDTSPNHLECTVSDDSGNIINMPVFVKYSPLLDPLKYMTGKYDVKDPVLMNLPSYNSTPSQCHPKVLDNNNMAYVDAFFSFLTSQCLHQCGIVHGLDYYGTYLCHQSEFVMNVYDDIEYLSENSYFVNNIDRLFSLDCPFDINTMMSDTRRNRKQLCIQTDDAVLELDDLIEECAGVGVSVSDSADNHLNQNQNQNLNQNHLDSISLLDEHDVIMIESDNDAANGIQATFDKRETSIDDDDSCSSCSSNTSHDSRKSDIAENDATDNDNDNTSNDNDTGSWVSDDNNSSMDCDSDDDDNDNKINEKEHDNDDNDNDDNDDNDNDNDNEDNEDDDEDDDEDDEKVIAKIKNFPVQAILLEQCKNTLDSLMVADDELKDDEWKSALFQIIMTLVIYQKLFSFTHNDLHTNNVMFVETEEEYIFYHYDNQYYKVPTFGRIFKIIDFGRSIYIFKGQVFCSDSFSPNGDATSQYNIEPYYNPKKPIVEPNYSFDLCRLGCSLYDYFIYDIKKEAKIVARNEIAELVVSWIKDDKGRNILYKSNGEERYLDFKLYKMIARTVHNCVPATQVNKALFDDYKITVKKYNTLSKTARNNKMKLLFMNVDILETLA